LLDFGHFFSLFVFVHSRYEYFGGLISPSHGRYLDTGQHKHRINTDIHASIGIGAHDPSAGAGEDSVIFDKGEIVLCFYWKKGTSQDRLRSSEHSEIVLTKPVPVSE
jgi:hypothetical protein